VDEIKWLYQTTDELRPFLAIDLFMKFNLDDIIHFSQEQLLAICNKFLDIHWLSQSSMMIIKYGWHDQYNLSTLVQGLLKQSHFEIIGLLL
jgi:hypothetical protein